MSNQIGEEQLLASTAARKDKQTVSPHGERLEQGISGVIIDRRPLHEDERGELQEIYNPAWVYSLTPSSMRTL